VRKACCVCYALYNPGIAKAVSKASLALMCCSFRRAKKAPLCRWVRAE
jgi:hypothetical protein